MFRIMIILHTLWQIFQNKNFLMPIKISLNYNNIRLYKYTHESYEQNISI